MFESSRAQILLLYLFSLYLYAKMMLKGKKRQDNDEQASEWKEEQFQFN